MMWTKFPSLVQIALKFHKNPVLIWICVLCSSQMRPECLLKIPQELAIKLKSQLEEMRKNKELQEAQVKGSGPGERAEEMVVLTRTDASGNVWPLEMTERQEPRGGRKKRKKVIIIQTNVLRTARIQVQDDLSAM